MKIPKEPSAVIFCGLIVIVASIWATLDSHLSSPSFSYLKLFFGSLAAIFGFWLIRTPIIEYKAQKQLSSRCTEKSAANIKFIGFEAKQGSSRHNTTFMILDLCGHERRFTNIVDEIRIQYSKGDQFPVFYNSLDKSEFVYDNTNFLNE